MADNGTPPLLILACVRSEAEAEAALAAGFAGTAGVRRAGAVSGWTAQETDGRAVFTLAEGGSLSRWRVFTDEVPDAAGVAALAGEGWSGVLIRSATRLLATMPVARLAALAASCRAVGLRVAVAGGLEPPDVPRLSAIGARVLLVGRALRDGEMLAPASLRLFAALAGQAGHAGAAVVATSRPDRILVRDLVCAIEVGAYRSEHGRTQRVRFTVEAEVPSAAGAARAMADVVSYDLITDAVARLTAGRHVAFVETLAEELAAAVLAEPRVSLVRVRVEKLDLGAHTVGVEIERRRADPA